MSTLRAGKNPEGGGVVGKANGACHDWIALRPGHYLTWLFVQVRIYHHHQFFVRVPETLVAADAGCDEAVV
jgi:hypothetical protein